MVLKSNNSDQVLNDIFAKHNEDLNLKLNSKNEFPEFCPKITLKIDDSLFKSMVILTNHHFGTKILKQEEYLQIVDLVNAKN